ncbi:MAG: hypothetical protein U5L10_02660 [Candidatus Moranbacteria bacterium]|nr:hypothetical protein [Candidatus Moranbacteria bacterium]
MKITGLIKGLSEQVDSKLVLPGFIGLTAAILTLVLTLDFLVASLVFVFSAAGLIFYKSFSKGWLFLLVIVLLFPTIKIAGTGLVLFELLLGILAVIGMIQLAIKDKKVLRNNLTFYFFLLFLIAVSHFVLGKIFGLEVSKEIWRIGLVYLMIWVLLVGFQYFFQTQKRIKRFFLIIIAAASIHSIFGVIAFLTNWQISTGLGISSGRMSHPLFENVTRQVNGFLGIGLEERIGSNPLASFLIAGIIATVSLIVINKQQEKALMKNKEKKPSGGKFLDGIVGVKKLSKRLADRKLFRKRMWLALLAIIQFTALFLTFSYYSLIHLGIGLLVMGVLMKRRRLLSLAAIYLVAFVIIIPGFSSSVGLISTAGVSGWLADFQQLKNNWVFGIGLGQGDAGSSPANSFYLIWSSYGLLGIIIFLKMLWEYFAGIYRKYESTVNGERIWFITVMATFTALLLEGLSSNVLIFGPTAVIFWLMYGVIINLGKNSLNSRFKKISYK